MALTLEDGNKVWQKVNKALAGGVGANPASVEAFRGLKMWLATQKGNPQLQFIPFSAEQVVTATGYQATDAPCKVYGLFAKGRRTTGTTSSFLDTHAAATDGATTTTVISNRFKAVGQQYATVCPDGIAHETALTIHAGTAVGGTVDSSAADAADGFVIVGAA
jgi:hypothetical protein